MALSDCVRCWDTPCTCGWDYREYPIKNLERKRDLIDKVIKWKQDHPGAVFGDRLNNQTKDDIDFMKYMDK